MVSGGARSLSSLGIVAPEEVQEIRRFQLRGMISLTSFVDQKRKGNTRFFAKHARIIPVAKADCREHCFFTAEGWLVFAQLRDVLAAKDSAVVPEKNQDSRLLGPQGPETRVPPIAIGQYDVSKFAAKRRFHVSRVLSSASRAVKRSKAAFRFQNSYSLRDTLLPYCAQR